MPRPTATPAYSSADLGARRRARFCGYWYWRFT